eukprot:NODE_415_length_3075_cov_7.220828.p1 GENE.NODE_415_length_3075_cov_7.220828~~NODE_415_length_3075_cov_7.220828.p1  ORF type:complete len:753 (+),score=151.86 NODE_415_length_3075_cov_7.220828:131-2389(+)
MKALSKAVKNARAAAAERAAADRASVQHERPLTPRQITTSSAKSAAAARGVPLTTAAAIEQYEALRQRWSPKKREALRPPASPNASPRPSTPPPWSNDSSRAQRRGLQAPPATTMRSSSAPPRGREPAESLLAVGQVTAGLSTPPPTELALRRKSVLKQRSASAGAETRRVSIAVLPPPDDAANACVTPPHTSPSNEIRSTSKERSMTPPRVGKGTFTRAVAPNFATSSRPNARASVTAPNFAAARGFERAGKPRHLLGMERLNRRATWVGGSSMDDARVPTWLTAMQPDGKGGTHSLSPRRRSIWMGVSLLDDLRGWLFRRKKSYSQAWREFLDVDGKGRLVLSEFSAGCRRLGYHGCNIRDLFYEICAQDANAITFQMLDEDTTESLQSFHGTVIANYNNMEKAIARFGLNPLRRLSREEFCRLILREGITNDADHAQQVFKQLCTSTTGGWPCGVTVNELTWLDSLFTVTQSRKSTHVDHDSDTTTTSSDLSEAEDPFEGLSPSVIAGVARLRAAEKARIEHRLRILGIEPSPSSLDGSPVRGRGTNGSNPAGRRAASAPHFATADRPNARMSVTVPNYAASRGFKEPGYRRSHVLGSAMRGAVGSSGRVLAGIKQPRANSAPHFATARRPLARESVTNPNYAADRGFKEKGYRRTHVLGSNERCMVGRSGRIVQNIKGAHAPDADDASDDSLTVPIGPTFETAARPCARPSVSFPDFAGDRGFKQAGYRRTHILGSAERNVIGRSGRV